MTHTLADVRRAIYFAAKEEGVRLVHQYDRRARDGVWCVWLSSESHVGLEIEVYGGAPMASIVYAVIDHVKIGPPSVPFTVEEVLPFTVEEVQPSAGQLLAQAIASGVQPAPPADDIAEQWFQRAGEPWPYQATYDRNDE